jgi:hypothetical protein
MILSVARAYGVEEDCKMNRKGFEKKWSWHNRNTVPQFVCRVRILDVPAKIWTKRLQSTSLGRYRYVNLLCTGRQLSETYIKKSTWRSQNFLYLKREPLAKKWVLAWSRSGTGEDEGDVYTWNPHLGSISDTTRSGVQVSAKLLSEQDARRRHFQ